MTTKCCTCLPSLVKKYLVAITGLVLVAFVLGHMLGNLQIFLPPEMINLYAHKLQSMPLPALWGFRVVMLITAVVHVVLTIQLTRQNRAARQGGYAVNASREASFASRTMIYSGLVLAAFIVFHILHYTTKSVEPGYNSLKFMLDGHEVTDVYAMMIWGFSNVPVSLFYIVSTGLLCLHISHGASSMFQSVGLRNEKWRKILNTAALAYGWAVFLGFAAIPAAVLGCKYTDCQALPVKKILNEIEAAKATGASKILIDYSSTKKS